MKMGHPYDDFAERIIRCKEQLKFRRGISRLLSGQRDGGLGLPLEEFARRIVREGKEIEFLCLIA